MRDDEQTAAAACAPQTDKPYRAMASRSPGVPSRFVAFHSDIDHVVGPSRNAMVLHPDLNARNIAVRGVGHLSMPHNGRIAFDIASALRDLDPDGTESVAAHL